METGAEARVEAEVPGCWHWEQASADLFRPCRPGFRHLKHNFPPSNPGPCCQRQHFWSTCRDRTIKLITSGPPAGTKKPNFQTRSCLSTTLPLSLPLSVPPSSTPPLNIINYCIHLIHRQWPFISFKSLVELRPQNSVAGIELLFIFK